MIARPAPDNTGFRNHDIPVLHCPICLRPCCRRQALIRHARTRHGLTTAVGSKLADLARQREIAQRSFPSP